jgi:hypothetical protein
LFILSNTNFTFGTLPVANAPLVCPILPFRYLISGHYKNEKFLKNVVRYLSSERYNDIMLFSVFAT